MSAHDGDGEPVSEAEILVVNRSALNELDLGGPCQCFSFPEGRDRPHVEGFVFRRGFCGNYFPRYSGAWNETSEYRNPSYSMVSYMAAMMK